MSTTTELDPVFRQALRLLHSSSSDAAENIRKALDDIIKQRHGPTKMLINTLSKKYLAEEANATGSGVVAPPPVYRRHSHKSSDSSSNNSNSSPVPLAGTVLPAGTEVSVQPQEMPMIISLPDDPADAADDNNIILDDTHLKDLEDLVCVVCRRIDLSAKNRLIECTKCNLLYHQDCHKPQIFDSDLNDEQEDCWICASCQTKLAKTSHLIASPAKSSSSHSSSSSSSSSNCIVSGHSSSKRSSEPSSSSHGHGSSSKSKSSSSHSKHHSSSSSSGGVTPSINIISADKRLQNMKKKAAKTHESKRKHKSSH